MVCGDDSSFLLLTGDISHVLDRMGERVFKNIHLISRETVLFVISLSRFPWLPFWNSEVTWEFH